MITLIISASIIGAFLTWRHGAKCYDKGITDATNKPALKLPKKTTKTKITMRAPSNKLVSTVLIALLTILVLSKKGSIASILEYNTESNQLDSIVRINSKSYEPSKGEIGILGAGNFTSAMIAPILSKLQAPVKYIASSNGLSGTLLGKKYGFKYSTTSYKDILEDQEVAGVLITTRHNLHAKQVVQGLKSSKHVFVEKPLVINLEELELVTEAYNSSKKSILVGFNRRFSPFSIAAKKVIGENPGAINVIATMNSGEIPKNHWTQDMEIGGGRIIGEACHYIDLISFFTSSKVKSVLLSSSGIQPEENTDNASILLKYENGSIGVINYFSNGHKSYPKERIEVYQSGNNLIIDNFKKIEFYGFKSKNFKGSLYT